MVAKRSDPNLRVQLVLTTHLRLTSMFLHISSSIINSTLNFLELQIDFTPVCYSTLYVPRLPSFLSHFPNHSCTPTTLLRQSVGIWLNERRRTRVTFQFRRSSSTLLQYATNPLQSYLSTHWFHHHRIYDDRLLDNVPTHV